MIRMRSGGLELNCKSIVVVILLSFSSILWILKNYVIAYQYGFLKDVLYRLDLWYRGGPEFMQIQFLLDAVQLDNIVITAGFTVSGLLLFYSRFLSQFRINRK